VLAAAPVAQAAPPGRAALVPNSVAFRNPTNGVLGTGWISCPAFGCKPQGTISSTTDGGRTWKVMLRTPRPVVWVGLTGHVQRARYDDGENVTSGDGGRTWHPVVPPAQLSTPCPPALDLFVQVVTTPAGNEWALCTSQGAAGLMGKAVYRLTARGWKRVAYTPLGSHPGYGGIGLYGYPLGMTMADDGFGLIWESRGTLYVTRDGGSHWVGLPRVVRPEADWGDSAVALSKGVGFIVLAHGGTLHRRLLVTKNRGRTWYVVHRWR
jgi:hypothetical protein